MSYWDEHGFLHAQNGVHNSENAILFRVMHDLIKGMSKEPYPYMAFYSEAHPEKDHTPWKLSLDNMNACCVFMSARLVKKLLKRIPWYVYARPDNFFTWTFASKNYLMYPLAALLMPLASLMMIYSCYKVYDKKPRGEGEHRVYVKLLATSGKLQVWTRLKAVPMPITQKICNYFINRSPWNGWKAVFGVYFEANHPLNGYPKENYEL